MNVANYYTLFTKEDDGKWYPQFGDYVRNVVIDEIASYRGDYKRKDIKIVKHYDNDCLDDLLVIGNP